RRACLNSFGFGGTNAHAVLEEPPQIEQDDQTRGEDAAEADLHVVPLSAHSEAALTVAAQNLREFCVDSSDDLLSIAHTTGVRRTHHPARLAVVASSKEDLIEQLSAYIDGQNRINIARKSKSTQNPESPAFLFTGMGPQWWAMGRELLEKEPV